MASQGVRIELREARRVFPETGPVIEKLDLNIESGEFVSLLGPSGCGKSTLLRLIAGLDLPDAGQVNVAVANGDGSLLPTGMSNSSFRGFVFQEAQLLPWRTALGNVGLPLELIGRPRGETDARARESLARVGLTDSLGKFPAQLSGGMKMRVSVARALITNPKLLLLDEPFAALDENTRFRLQEDLRALWLKNRMTVVFVTHSVMEAAFLSDRSIVLSSRPARVLLDRRTQLSFARDRATRTDAAYLREVEVLSAAFREGEAK